MKMTKQGIVDEVHKPIRRNFPRRKVNIKGLNDLWQADLIEMIPYAKQNKGFKYILTVINAFSKYVYVKPMKSKSGKDVLSAMKKILCSVKTTPDNLQTDQGTEFFNRQFGELVKSFNINHYSVYSTKKACIAERVIRTLKTKLWKTFSLRGSYKWLDIIDTIVQEYNNSVHRTIGMKPSEVTMEDEPFIQEKLNVPNVTQNQVTKRRFKKGDYVRISKAKSIFEKGYTPNWSAEVFIIEKVLTTKPVTYILKDINGTSIKGCFYSEELQRSKFKDTYLVEKVLRKKKDKAYVKWWGFDSSHNSWIKTKDIL